MTGRYPRLAACILFLALGAGALAGCRREPVLARGPFTIDKEPSTVPFERAVPAGSSHWVLSLEFERPGDSKGARAILLALEDERGHRCPLRVLRVDRRGENRVALEGRLDCGVSAAGTGPDAAPWVAVVWASPTPVVVRTLAGADLDGASRVAAGGR